MATITPSIVTTGQDNINQIIRDHYPDEDPKATLKALELANPHIVSLTSLTVGSRLYLPEKLSQDNTEDTGERPVVTI
jgi:hypothetical protein